MIPGPRVKCSKCRRWVLRRRAVKVGGLLYGPDCGRIVAAQSALLAWYHRFPGEPRGDGPGA